MLCTLSVDHCNMFRAYVIKKGLKAYHFKFKPTKNKVSASCNFVTRPSLSSKNVVLFLLKTREKQKFGTQGKQ